MEEKSFTSGMLYTVNATEAFEGMCEIINEHGIETQPRGQKVKEMIGFNLRIDDPRDRIVTSPARKISYRYLLAEFIWYMSGQSHVDTIKDYAPFWATIAAEDGTVNSNYGYRIFGYSPEVPYNQWEKVKELFKADPDTRQAVIHINASYDYTKPTKDRPCTLNLQWFIRDNKLILKVGLRSNDLVMGFGNDVFQFTMLHELMCCQLRNEGFPDLELGPYLHDAGSMHVYDRHYAMIEEVIANPTDFETQPKRMSIMQLKDTDIANLITIEKHWRENCGLAKGCITYASINCMPEFVELSQYWQNLINVCFFDQDKVLILEA